jgi:hypothetical protein
MKQKRKYNKIVLKKSKIDYKIKNQSKDFKNLK